MHIGIVTTVIGRIKRPSVSIKTLNSLPHKPHAAKRGSPDLKRVPYTPHGPASVRFPIGRSATLRICANSIAKHTKCLGYIYFANTQQRSASKHTCLLLLGQVSAKSYYGLLTMKNRQSKVSIIRRNIRTRRLNINGHSSIPTDYASFS